MMSILFFIITLCVMVIVHEYGHYIVARFFNVAISVFSIGFGPAFLKRVSTRTQVEFRLSPFLLGGYVKFAESLQAHPKQILFEDLGLGKKILVLIAGPLANIILAFIALVIFFKLESYSLLPYIGPVTPGSIAQELGLQQQQKIVQMNTTPVFSWEDVVDVVNQKPETLVFVVEKGGMRLTFPVKTQHLESKGKDFFQQMGFKPMMPLIPALIFEIKAGSPAEQAGLLKGDTIVSINGKKIRYMYELSEFVSTHPGEKVVVDFLRQGQRDKTDIQLERVERNGQASGKLGIYSLDFKAYPQWFHKVHLSWAQALQKACVSIYAFCKVHIAAWMHIHEQFTHLSGPIGMAKAADQAWSMGIRMYLFFVVWINIGLAIINLLPLPILDGGQCILLILRKIFPRLMSPKRQNIIMIWSIVFLFGLFVLGLANDLAY